MRKSNVIVLILLVWAGLAANLSGQTFKVHRFSVGGDGGTDCLTVDPSTNRVFVARESHVMVLDGTTGRIVGDIPNTPGVHGIALAVIHNRGFTTNGGDSTVSMFDLDDLAVIKKTWIPAGGLDGIMYDDFTDRIILTNHSTPGTATALDAGSGEIVGQVELEDDSPEGAAGDWRGRLFINNGRRNTIQVINARKMSVMASWPLDPCKGPTGMAYDQETGRIFSACSKTSAVLDAATGKIVATIPNGDGVDAIGWDPGEKLIYIPAGRDSNVTIVHQDSPNSYTVIATVTTAAGAKTISVDPVRHVAYLFQPVYALPTSDTAPGPSGRAQHRPIVAAFLYVITH